MLTKLRKSRTERTDGGEGTGGGCTTNIIYRRKRPPGTISSLFAAVASPDGP